MKMFDILVSKKGNLEWVCGIFASDVNHAIQCAIVEFGKCNYVGHKEFTVKNGEWVESN